MLDARVPVPTLPDTIRHVAPGTRYVLCVLRPSGDLSLDAAGQSRQRHRQLGVDGSDRRPHE
jgi:hypothetical protein